MGWKKFAEAEKGAVDRVEHESHVDGFFFFDTKGAVHHEFTSSPPIIPCIGVHGLVSLASFMVLLHRLRKR
jgi:hypothetical protein